MTKTSFVTGVITLLLFVSPSTAEIKTLTLTSDTRPTILFHRFGFTHTGHVAITVSLSAPPPPQSEPSLLGFFLLTGDSFSRVRTEINQNIFFCFLHSHHIIPLFTFHLLPPPPSPFNHTYPVTTPGEYSLFFANCDNNNHSSVSMTVHMEFFNLEKDGSRNYLSSGHTHLPSFSFFLLPFSYFSLLITWLYLCRHVNNRIHLLMSSLLVANAVTIMCIAMATHYVKLTGFDYAWNEFFLVFHLVRVVLFFIIVVLVGTRWTFLHPFVRERGKKVLFVLIPLQALAEVAYVVTHHNTGSFIDGTWYQVFLLLDFVSCFVLVFLVVWCIRLLAKITSKLITLGEVDAMNIYKFSLIRCFYNVIIAYLFLSRFVLFGLINVVGGDYQWVSNIVEETATLVICIVMFYVFRVLEKDEYYEEDVAEIVIKE